MRFSEASAIFLPVFKNYFRGGRSNPLPNTQKIHAGHLVRWSVVRELPRLRIKPN